VQWNTSLDTPTQLPVAHADAGDRSVAEQAVQQVYVQRQKVCTPSLPPQFKGITWDNFYPAAAGEGRIIDANPSLGGLFKAYWTNPRVGAAQSSPSRTT
jgi:hypothetical protein